MDRVIGLRDGRLAENILGDYYGVDVFERVEREHTREPVPVPVPTRPI